jgi:hypothetical protein
MLRLIGETEMGLAAVCPPDPVTWVLCFSPELSNMNLLFSFAFTVLKGAMVLSLANLYFFF